MHKYLLPDENWNRVVTHNEDIVKETTVKIGQAVYQDRDFNRPEEFKQLDGPALWGVTDPQSLNTKAIAMSMFNDDNELLVRRVRSHLSFGSQYQKTLINGNAVIARPDGTLRFTHTPTEYGDLVDEDAAKKMGRLTKYVNGATMRLNKQLNTASEKVPEIKDRMAETRQEAHTHMSSVFSRNLELLAGD